MRRARRRDPEAPLKDLTDPWLREQFGTPVPGMSRHDVETEALALANETAYEDALLRRRPRPLP